MIASLVDVRLYGHLRKKFGKSYLLDVHSASEAVRALSVVVPGFKQYMLQNSAPGYRVWSGGEAVSESRELSYPCGRVVKIVPAIAGAKSGGLGQVFLGAALIAVSFALPVTPLISGFAFSASSIAMSLGSSLLLGGISQMLAKSPTAPTQTERPDNQPSYAFNGAVNTTSQGNPVSILYGRLRVGSQVISAGLSSSALPA